MMGKEKKEAKKKKNCVQSRLSVMAYGQRRGEAGAMGATTGQPTPYTM